MPLVEDKKQFYTAQEISAALGLPVTSVLRWARLGRVPAIKVGGRVLFSREPFDAMFDAVEKAKSECDFINVRMPYRKNASRDGFQTT